MIIIDQAIDDEQLLADIVNDSSAFVPPTKLPHDKPINLLDGSERAYSDYVFWEGWETSPANTTKKRIIQNLWSRFLPFPYKDLFGIEYWTVSALPKQYLDWHVDTGFCYCHPSKDEPAAKAAMGAIYYPPSSDFEETFLELRFDNGVERIATAPNRLVIFDSANTYHRTTPTQSSIRYSMPMNLWNRVNPPTLFRNFSIKYEETVSILV